MIIVSLTQNSCRDRERYAFVLLLSELLLRYLNV